MSLNNKGSVLIVTLIIFSIISTVCIMCMGLIYSNNNIANLEYRDNMLKELALSGIEISISNIFTSVEEAIDVADSEIEFREYFLGNNMVNCINKIKDISNSNLDEVSLEIKNNTIYEENNHFMFNIISTVKINDYSKMIKAKVKIKNPWIGINIEDYKINEGTKNNESENIEPENAESIEKNDLITLDDIIEKIKKGFDAKELIYVYEYRGV